MSALSSNAVKVQVTEPILQTESDWEPWIIVVESLAGDNWKYIDPSIPNPPQLTRPNEPSPINFGGTTYDDVPDDQRNAWLSINDLYYKRLKQYEKEKLKLETVDKYIITHISKPYLLQKANYTSTHSFLVGLKSALCPTELNREQQIVKDYAAAKIYNPKRSNFDTWAQEYKTAYLRAKQVNIPDVNGLRAHWDLVRAIRPLDLGYSAILSREISRSELKPEADRPTLESLLDEFIHHYHHTKTSSTYEVNNSAFATATLQGEEQRKRKREDKPCICGDLHPWGKCPILIEHLREPNFVLDPEKERLVNEKLKSNPALQGIIKSVQEREKRRRITSSSSSRPRHIDLDSKHPSMLPGG